MELNKAYRIVYIGNKVILLRKFESGITYIGVQSNGLEADTKAEIQTVIDANNLVLTDEQSEEWAKVE